MTEDVIEGLAALTGGAAYEPPEPDDDHGLELDMKWRPRLNPVQEIVYACKSNYILTYGERGTGKSVAGLHKLVRHLVNNRNALALVIVREVGQATEGGAWHKLSTEILPQWKNGNFDRRTGKRLDRGCGTDFTSPRLDAADKKSYMWVANRFGGWSMVKLISLFVGDAVEDKIKGKEASFIFVDEAQTMEGTDYFTKIIQQIGRRQDITDPQQVIYACNPKGPSHWLYQTFFMHGLDEEGKLVEWPIDTRTGHPINPADDSRLRKWGVFHVPITENRHNLPEEYWDNVLTACKSDPTEYARMVEGIWVDRPEGEAMFKEVWSDAKHIRGNALKSQGLMPLEKHLFILGWDPGAAHTSISMLQFVATTKKIHWLLFDEICSVGKYLPYRLLVPKVIERMLYWEHAAREHYGHEVIFKYLHVADLSAFNQFRAKEGSFDAQDIQDISRAYVAEKELPERFVIQMRAAPKGPHSVEARVRIATDLLFEDCLAVSALCPKHREMFMQLEGEKDNRMKPKRSKHIHVFDSITYPVLFFNSGAGRPATRLQTTTLKSEMYRI